MTYYRPTPTPTELIESPQLASLAMLNAALTNARAAITASHLELMSGVTFDDAPPHSPSAWVALDAINMIDALANVLESYRYSLKPHRTTPSCPHDFKF